jgi:hypothetical protein
MSLPSASGCADDSSSVDELNPFCEIRSLLPGRKYWLLLPDIKDSGPHEIQQPWLWTEKR